MRTVLHSFCQIHTFSAPKIPRILPAKTGTNVFAGHDGADIGTKAGIRRSCMNLAKTVHIGAISPLNGLGVDIVSRAMDVGIHPEASDLAVGGEEASDKLERFLLLS